MDEQTRSILQQISDISANQSRMISKLSAEVGLYKIAIMALLYGREKFDNLPAEICESTERTFAALTTISQLGGDDSSFQDFAEILRERGLL